MVTAMVCIVAALLVAGCGSDAEPAASEVATAADTATVAAVATTAPPTEPSASVALPPPTALVVPTPQPPTPVPTVAPTAEPEPIATAVQPPSSAAAPTAAPAPASNQSLEGQIANGAEVYTLNCARCHAENGTGTERYSGLIGVGSRYSTAGMIAELTTGHPVTFGFADRLSADEIASVVAYVKATFP